MIGEFLAPQLYLSPSSEMKTVNGSNVIILDGGLVRNSLGSGSETWSHLRSRDLSWRIHLNKTSRIRRSGLRNP